MNRVGNRTAQLSRRCALVVSLLLAFLLAGCRTQIGVQRVTPRQAYEQVNVSALTGTVMSAGTATVMHRFSVAELFKQDPRGAIRLLHGVSCSDSRRDTLLALSEMSFAAGERFRRSVKPVDKHDARSHYLASAIYAYWFLFGEGSEPPPTAYDRRFRLACDIYNYGLARALATPEGDRLVFGSGSRELPQGRIELEIKKPGFPWDLDRIEGFRPADIFAVRGISARIRDPGLGVPFIAIEKGADRQPFPSRAAATAFLRVEGGICDFSSGPLKGTIELYSTYDEGIVSVGQQHVPLETDSTAPLAYELETSPLWELGVRQFFSAQQWVKNDVYLTQPYQPGRIPVVFVHGTASSPVWWAEMWNTLRSDLILRKRYQFWVYLYNTGNPINHSAANLRESLSRMVQKLDPEGKDEALKHMVVVGHSQGGLLTKMTVVDSGDNLWSAMNKQPFNPDKLKPDDRRLVSGRFFMKRLPFVERVVFIATPHRGSYRVKPWVMKLARTWISFPAEVVRFGEAVLKLRGKDSSAPELPKILPTSIDNMSPDHPLLKALAELPVSKGVHSHSIIAVRGDVPWKDGDDGVVKYDSAHLEHVDSEKVVRASHSCQDQPETIEELRRILKVHLEGVDARAD